MIIHPPSEIAFYIFNFPIYWYGIILALAVAVGILSAELFAKYKQIPANFFINNSPILVIFGILGARLYYCDLHLSYYLSHPLEILDIRQGGLSLHGMIFVGIVIIVLLAKKHKINTLSLLDVTACSLPLAQAVGRWGNFFNSEAFGIPTNGNWGLFIPLSQRPELYIKYELFHPTFLYESLLNLLVFCVLFYVLKNTKRAGNVFFVYLILYSFVRIIVEQFRVDSALYLLSLPIAQVVSVILFIGGIVGLSYINKKSN